MRRGRDQIQRASAAKPQPKKTFNRKGRKKEGTHHEGTKITKLEQSTSRNSKSAISPCALCLNLFLRVFRGERISDSSPQRRRVGKNSQFEIRNSTWISVPSGLELEQRDARNFQEFRPPRDDYHSPRLPRGR